MGKKNRRHRPKNDDDDNDKEDVQAQSPPKSNAGTNLKDLDFAARRELQRKAAAEKRRARMKCHICGDVGHVRRECPGVRDDGRGMSRFKKKSNVNHEKELYQARKYGTPQQDSSSSSLLEYPPELNACDFRYYDVACDIASTMDYCKQGRGKTKISQKEAFQEVQTALIDAQRHTNLGGMISQTLLKPNRPWICPNNNDIPLPAHTWYMIGLARDFLYNDSEMDAAVNSLTQTLHDHPDKIVGYWAILDYTICQRPGCDKESQKRRVIATCKAAGQAGVTVQIQALPGAAGLDLDQIAGTDYAHVLLDLQTILTDATTEFPTLQIVLANWSGLASHMLSFLQACPHLTIGLDGSVSFAKAGHLHECAFDLPLDKLVLMTSHVIPAEIANLLGRDAFYHAGLWPFVARAVAHYKKTVSIVDVARACSERTLQLYPQLLVAAEAAEEEDVVAAEEEEAESDPNENDTAN
ncbi:expressed unknown protein [Seminavis robusta]|uniref:CCHC-type domain-containing protein n=1 Tax=Seminavis robusta TaxID=568900 RepID=A0A9N8EMW5_9STRA|nr:expressed unknown protein [Seminavis robusta]|eukprot:Sro1487_g276760.1 n/a (468) ;mRNA; r:12229-13632